MRAEKGAFNSNTTDLIDRAKLKAGSLCYQETVRQVGTAYTTRIDDYPTYLALPHSADLPTSRFGSLCLPLCTFSFENVEGR